MARKIKVKLILELHEQGVSMNEISSTRKISKHSVCATVEKAKQKGLSYKNVKDMTDDAAYRLVFPERHANEEVFEQPDMENVHQELGKVGVTLKLLHAEYCDECRHKETIAMSYSKSCRDYERYTIQGKFTSHLDHKPGEKTEVDWSGPKMQFVDLDTGELVETPLFVSSLPYSHYSYVAPCLDMKEQTWLQCHADIYSSMACIMADIDAVGKNQKNQQQGFKFRGIDDIYNAVHPILAKHGVFTVPTVLSERSEERTTTRGGNLIYRILMMKYTFFASDGSSVNSVVIGEGMDSGDKAANKAMSVAHKYALLQALCIPTEEIADPDKESFEVTQSQNTQSSLSLARSVPRQDTSPNLAGLLSVEEFNIKDAWNSILERCRGDQVAAREVFKKHGADSSKEITYEIYQNVFLSLQIRKAQDTKGPEDFIDDEIPFSSSKKRVIA